jgi:hypothetical protein
MKSLSQIIFFQYVNMCLPVLFVGKTFLNSIEYLDEKTNEWTTFVPKLSAQSCAGSPQPDPTEVNSIFLQSLDLHTEEAYGMDSHGSVDAFHVETSAVEGIVPPHRKRSENNIEHGGSGSIMRFETSS